MIPSRFAHPPSPQRRGVAANRSSFWCCPMTEFSDALKVPALLTSVAEPTSLRVLWQLAKGPQHVGALAELIDIPTHNMSHHLGVMRQAGVLDDEKDGRKFIYKLRPEVF